MLTAQPENQRIFLKERGTCEPDAFLSQAARWYIYERTRFISWTKSFTSSLPLGILADLTRSKSELLAENALLRQPLIVLKRQVKRPARTNVFCKGNGAHAHFVWCLQVLNMVC